MTKPSSFLEPALNYAEVAARLKRLQVLRAKAGGTRSHAGVSGGPLHEGFGVRTGGVASAGQLERAESKRIGRGGRRELRKETSRPQTTTTGKKDYSHIDLDIRERLGMT